MRSFVKRSSPSSGKELRRTDSNPHQKEVETRKGGEVFPCVFV